MAINNVLPKGVDFSKYLGQWVVICENKVVAHNKSLSKIQNRINECRSIPTIAKIPKHETLIF